MIDLFPITETSIKEPKDAQILVSQKSLL